MGFSIPQNRESLRLMDYPFVASVALVMLLFDQGRARLEPRD